MYRYELGCSPKWDLYFLPLVLDGNLDEEDLTLSMIRFRSTFVKGFLADYIVGYHVERNKTTITVNMVLAHKGDTESRRAFTCLRRRITRAKRLGYYLRPLRKVRSGN